MDNFSYGICRFSWPNRVFGRHPDTETQTDRCTDTERQVHRHRQTTHANCSVGRHTGSFSVSLLYAGSFSVNFLYAGSFSVSFLYAGSFSVSLLYAGSFYCSLLYASQMKLLKSEK